MNDFAGKHILVVGASGAFGQEFCSQLQQRGALVSGTARTAESSVRLPATLAHRLLLDLESTDSISAVASYLLQSAPAIDGIILASGLVAFGSIAETPSVVTHRLMQVNALGQIQLVQQLLPALTASASAGRSPFVVSISGVIAEAPLPGLAAYSASKTAMHGFATAAARELRKAGISWIDARPGHTESGLANRAIFGTAPNFGAGMQTAQVVDRIIQGLVNQEKDLPSSAF
jgi:short-subunit dehydrogenase